MTQPIYVPNGTGIQGFDQPQQEDPRVGESKLTEGERLTLAQQRSRDINLFSSMEEATRYHKDNIIHLLTEEKYEAFLPVMLSPILPGQVNWAPNAGVHVSRCLDIIAKGNDLDWSCSSYLDDVEQQILEDYRLSTIKRPEFGPLPATTPVFNYIPRMMVEYNTKFVQLCVVVVVRQGGKYLLLRTPDEAKARVRNKLTFIQGHVEIDNDVNDMTALAYLTREAEREINEEVQGLESQLQFLDYKGLFHDSSDAVSQEHISAVFEISVDTDIDLNIDTNEADKHSARLYTLEEMREEGIADNIVSFILGV